MLQTTVTLYKRDKSWQNRPKQHESALFCRSGDHNGVWSQLPSCRATLVLTHPLNPTTLAPTCACILEDIVMKRRTVALMVTLTLSIMIVPVFTQCAATGEALLGRLAGAGKLPPQSPEVGTPVP